jgi:hypothetical protein
VIHRERQTFHFPDDTPICGLSLVHATSEKRENYLPITKARYQIVRILDVRIFRSRLITGTP